VDSGSNDTTYIFGEGTINTSTGTFQIDIETPPTEALSGSIGVGILIVTTNTTLETGDAIDNVSDVELVGAAGMYAIIYLENQSIQEPAWVSDFSTGYNVGIGMAASGTFDIFVPTAADSPVLIIDDFANITFVNWS
jgi:pantoate kinase